MKDVVCVRGGEKLSWRGCRLSAALVLVVSAGLWGGCGGGEKTLYASGMLLNKKELILGEGRKEKLTVTLEPENTTYQEVVWQSTNPEVAVVDSNGEIRALKVGDTTITATLKRDGRWDNCFLEVVNPSIDNFEPKAAGHGTKLVIYGQGFSAREAGNTVSLNGVPVKVLSARGKRIEVEVPRHTRCSGPKREDCSGVVEIIAGGSRATMPTFTYVPKVNVSTFAGDGTAALRDGSGALAQFYQPIGIAIDAAGNLYVADHSNNRIRKLVPDGRGSANVSTLSVNAGALDLPAGITLDAAGNLYVANFGSNSVSKLVPNNQGGASISTLAGGADVFTRPYGITIDTAGNLYVADSGSQRIRKLVPNAEGGADVSTLAGYGEPGEKDGPGVSAQFREPRGLVADAAGNLYVADTNNDRIRLLKPDGQGGVNVSVFAGPSFYDPGTNDFTWMKKPIGLTVDAAGILYVADSGNHRILKVVDGHISILAGDGTQNHRDGAAAQARFDWPEGMVVDAEGSLYVAEYGNHRIRKITFE